MKFWQKLLSVWWWFKNSVFLSRPFWKNFCKKKNFVFASFPWKLVDIYRIARMGQIFDDYPDFQKIPGMPILLQHSVSIYFWNQTLLDLRNKNGILKAEIIKKLLYYINIVWEGWRQPVRFTKILAKMRICCYGSPTTFVVENVRKCQTEAQTEWVNIFWTLVAFFFCLQNFFETNKKNSYQNSKYINIFCLGFSLAFSYIVDYKGSWWTIITNPHFSQNLREMYRLPSAFLYYAWDFTEYYY